MTLYDTFGLFNQPCQATLRPQSVSSVAVPPAARAASFLRKKNLSTWRWAWARRKIWSKLVEGPKGFHDKSMTSILQGMSCSRCTCTNCCCWTPLAHIQRLCRLTRPLWIPYNKKRWMGDHSSYDMTSQYRLLKKLYHLVKLKTGSVDWVHTTHGFQISFLRPFAF